MGYISALTYYLLLLLLARVKRFPVVSVRTARALHLACYWLCCEMLFCRDSARKRAVQAQQAAVLRQQWHYRLVLHTSRRRRRWLYPGRQQSFRLWVKSLNLSTFLAHTFQLMCDNSVVSSYCWWRERRCHCQSISQSVYLLVLKM